MWLFGFTWRFCELNLSAGCPGSIAVLCHKLATCNKTLSIARLSGPNRAMPSRFAMRFESRTPRSRDDVFRASDAKLAGEELGT